MSALKKSDLDGSILLRLYEIQGAQAETPIEFLGQQVGFREANLLEEEVRPNEERVLRLNPYEIKTVKLGVRK
jgi:alpha-mannosidase